jgi:hypothetical protein
MRPGIYQRKRRFSHGNSIIINEGALSKVIKEFEGLAIQELGSKPSSEGQEGRVPLETIGIFHGLLKLS